MLALKLLCLFVALHQEVPLPAADAQDEPTAKPETQAVGPSNSIIDLRRLELVPQLGFTLFSADFEGEPSPCLGLLARAPLPFLAPREDAQRETFGAFLQFSWSTLDRDLAISGSTDGNLFFIGAGLDFLMLRQQDVFLRGQIGVQYGLLSDVTLLDDGFALLTGVLAGVQLVQGVWFTWDVELVFGNSGDWILFNQAGVAIRF